MPSEMLTSHAKALHVFSGIIRNGLLACIALAPERCWRSAGGLTMPNGAQLQLLLLAAVVLAVRAIYRHYKRRARAQRIIARVCAEIEE